MRIESVDLPEFGLDVNWAMCRNPMCADFGIAFEGEIPEGRKQASTNRYTLRVTLNAHGHPAAVLACRGCGQRVRLASNRAVRLIARYFLSLSLPYADCSDTDCKNHGVNVFEHWAPPDDGRRPYRPVGTHTVRCNRCGTNSGTDANVPSILLGTPRRAVDRPATRDRWRDMPDALHRGRSGADITDSLGISHATCHRYLARLGARLGDYHAFRNARLLRPDTPNRDRPVWAHTGVMRIDARLSRWPDCARPLPVIVTVATAGGPPFVLAAHPCFLPSTFCPDAATLAADSARPPLESEWAALRHPYGDDALRGPESWTESPWFDDSDPIARYFLSLSLPFADCPNEECRNHRVNAFEHGEQHFVYLVAIMDWHRRHVLSWQLSITAALGATCGLNETASGEPGAIHPANPISTDSAGRSPRVVSTIVGAIEEKWVRFDHHLDVE